MRSGRNQSEFCSVDAKSGSQYRRACAAETSIPVMLKAYKDKSFFRPPATGPACVFRDSAHQGLSGLGLRRLQSEVASTVAQQGKEPRNPGRLLRLLSSNRLASKLYGLILPHRRQGTQNCLRGPRGREWGNVGHANQLVTHTLRKEWPEQGAARCCREAK